MSRQLFREAHKAKDICQAHWRKILKEKTQSWVGRGEGLKRDVDWDQNTSFKTLKEPTLKSKEKVLCFLFYLVSLELPCNGSPTNSCCFWRFNKFSVAGIMFRGSKHLLQQLSGEEVVYIAWVNTEIRLSTTNGELVLYKFLLHRHLIFSPLFPLVSLKEPNIHNRYFSNCIKWTISFSKPVMKDSEENGN